MSIKHHSKVFHPDAILADRKKPQSYLVEKNDNFLDWITNHVLASIFLFDIALIIPLLVLPMPNNIKVILAVISSNWMQWWALPAIQRSQVKTDAKRDAKNDADHIIHVHLATQIDKIAKKIGV